MAKDESKQIDKIIESINDKYGTNVVVSGDFLREHSGCAVSTGMIGWDIALHGGIKEGTITHIGGLTASGKTTLCLNIAVQAQKLGKNVYYVDVEGRVQDELLDCIEGIDKSKLRFIRSSREKFLTAEEYLSIIEDIIKDDPGCVIILDSLAALCPEAEFTTEMSEMQRATMPKLMYKFLRKVAQIIPPNKTIFISITHMQANPSGYGSPLKDVGGNGIQFFASYWLICMSSTDIDGKDGKKVGKESKFKVKKVANGSPGAEPILYITFGKGCDKYADICKIAEDIGILTKGGAWYTLELDALKDASGKYPKMQGMENMKTYLQDNPKSYTMLAEKIKEMVL